MSYHDQVEALSADPGQLEQVYHAAENAGESSIFREAIEAVYAAQPDNLLYAAWAVRLRYSAARATEFVIAWAWAIPLALLNGLLFWWLSDDRYQISVIGYLGQEQAFMPAFLLWAAPLAALFVLAYLSATGDRAWPRAILAGALLLLAAAYAYLVYPRLGSLPFQRQYLTLASFHLPLLAWVGIGAYLVAKHRDPHNRFAFLISSLEVIVVGGLFAIAGILFAAITFGLFDALAVEVPETVLRLFVAGGGGLLPVIVVAVVYNPAAPPAGQAFDQGLGKLVALLPRILLPLALLVLVVYLVFVLFNFRAPFENRDVLITYNIMLFAVVALLVGATPLSAVGLSPRMTLWLRRGIFALAALSLLVGLYALAAIGYRTAQDRLTPNRLTFIGWNIVNIGLLAHLLWRQARADQDRWIAALHETFSAGTVAYTAWTLIVLLGVPWLFGIDQGKLSDLPASVQELVYEQPDPILLKCSASPHVYLLENGQKRWIDTIETFSASGFEWSDVQIIPCADLRDVPDGVSIPSTAGPPPQP